MNDLTQASELASGRPSASRRHLLTGGLTGAGILATLVACGAPAASRSGLEESTRPVTLEWFGKLKGIPQSDVEAFVQQYTAARPHVTLNVTSVSNTAEGQVKLASYAAAGTPVDVISTFAGIPDLRRLNGDAALDDYIKRDKFDVSQFAPNTIRRVVVKGKTLALPHAYAGNELALVANKAIFQRAGVPLPAADWKASWTWTQFREALKRLTGYAGNPPVAGTSRFGTIYNIPPMWGARWASDDGSSILATSPEMIQAWTEYYAMVVKDGSARFSPQAPDLGGELPAFLGGKAATITICCAVPTTTVRFKDNNIDWAFLPFPKATHAVADIAGAVIAIWSQSRSPDEAWRFLRWSIEEGRLADLEQRMPSQTKAIQPYVQKVYGSTPDVRPDVFLKAPEYGLPLDALWQSPASGEAGTLINEAFAEVRQGTRTPAATLNELKPQLQALLDEYRDG